MKNIKKISQMLLVMVLMGHESVFGKVITSKDSLVGSSAIIVNQTCVVQDPFYGTTPSAANYVDAKVNARVSLVIDPKKTSGIPSAPATVNVEIKYYLFNGTSMVLQPVKAVALSVAYTATGTYTNVSYIDLGPAYRVEAKIVGVNGLNVAHKLVNEIRVERYYKPSLSVSNLNHGAPDYANSQLQVTWDHIPNAEYYELEWAPIESFLSLNSAQEPIEVSVSQIPVGKNYFRFNATRVTTTNASYDIPLVYEKGYLVFRVRAVYYKIDGANKMEQFTNWTVSDDKLLLSDIAEAHRVKLDGFEATKNWQATINYAEEGKNKASVTFADGTLRKRQDQIRLNTERKTMVLDDIYDHQGRLAIQTLSAPTNSLSLKYRDGFSRNAMGIYNRKDFDLDQSPTDCSSPVGIMDSSSGASQYYSRSNIFIDSKSSGSGDKIENRDLIPKAGGYPFSQTVYMPDQTGRVAATSIPGKDFRIGGGHDTRMYYGTPTQEELYRLFGHEVGNATHYKKNMVRDPNGQYTVSYLDMRGKTIASALAGEGPLMLNKLSSNTSKALITSDLFYARSPEEGANKMTPDKMGFEFSKSLAIIDGNKYKIDYKLTSGSYQPESCIDNGQPSKCYSCVVDVETAFKEKPCADNLSSAPAFRFGKQGNGSVCPSKDSSLSLYNTTIPSGAGGTYVLSKKVKINEAKLQEYTRQYLGTTCLKTLEDFVIEELAKADPNWCGLNCDQCKNKFVEVVGSYEVWAARQQQPAPPIEEYYKLRDQTCLNFCDTKWNDCSMAFEVMLADMSPMGQYGEIYENTFNTGNSDGLLTIDEDGDITDNLGPQGPGLNTGTEESVTDDETPDFSMGAFKPEAHKLSIYNDQNILPVKADHVTSVKSIPNWRKPIWVEGNTVYNSYYDDDDHKVLSTIPLQQNRDENNVIYYVPKVLDETQVYLSQGTYYTSPQNLKEVSDFATTYWRKSWARSLVFYHPEYPYYAQCIDNLSSVTFDQKWNNTQTLQIAEANQYINRNTVRFDPTTIDPYFANAHFYERLLIKKRMREYGTDVNGKKIDIWALTNKTVNCASGKNCSLACDDTVKINSDQEWLVFKSLYASVKQEVLRNSAQKTAIKKIYYNGCIGNSDFDESDYGFSNTIIKREVVTGYRFCNAWQQIWGCQEGSYTYTETSEYKPSEDAAQYCHRSSAPDYKDKAKRFWQEPNLEGEGNQLKLSNCYDTLRVDAVTLDYIKVPCREDVQALNDELRAEASRKVYEECGVCPLIWDLQHFLSDMAKNHKLSLTTVDLSCPPANGIASFTPLIERSYLSTNGTLTSNRIQYISALSSGNKTLTIKFVEEGAPVPSASHLVLNIPQDAAFDFTKFNSICCIQVTNTSDPNLQGKLFTAVGKVTILGLPIAEVPIQGISSVALAPCEIPLRCVPSKNSVQIGRLLNALNVAVGVKANHLLDHSGNVSLVSVVNYYPMIDQLEHLSGFKSQNPSAVFDYKWSGSATSTKLTGTIPFKITVAGTIVAQGSRLIELSAPSGTSVDFSKIMVFSNIKMKECSTDDCQSHTFTIDAQFKNASGEISIVKLDGNTSYFMGRCKQAIALGNSQK